MKLHLDPLTFGRSLWRILRGQPRIPPSLQDNALLATILRRRSVRSFSDRPIADDVFAAILEAGRLAPSTVNLQTWSFITFTPTTWRATFGAGLPFGGQRGVLVLADTSRYAALADTFPRTPLVMYTMAVINASLAAMNMNLAAEALGVSSVMLSETGRSGFLDAGYLREKLDLPAGVIPLMTIVFGYARGPYPPMPPKLLLEQICGEARYRPTDPAVVAEWLAQMVAGYKASHPFSSFEVQLKVYRAKIIQAEADLHRMISAA